MNVAALDLSDARNVMVDGQLRPNKVNDPRILSAMRLLRRELFVPGSQAPFAYLDTSLALGDGRFLLEPMVLARMIQILRPIVGQRALVIGAGAGYGAAVLAACGPHVTALESDSRLFDLAHVALSAAAPHAMQQISLVQGSLQDGWAEGAPYDLILIEGALVTIPPLIAEQLRQPNGRLAGILARVANSSHAVIGEAVPGGLRTRPLFDCAAPILFAVPPPQPFAFPGLLVHSAHV